MELFAILIFCRLFPHMRYVLHFSLSGSWSILDFHPSQLQGLPQNIQETGILSIRMKLCSDWPLHFWFPLQPSSPIIWDRYLTTKTFWNYLPFLLKERLFVDSCANFYALPSSVSSLKHLKKTLILICWSGSGHLQWKIPSVSSNQANILNISETFITIVYYCSQFLTVSLSKRLFHVKRVV